MTLAAGDLTTLATVKAYAGTQAPADAVLSGLISRISMMIRSDLNRQLLLPRDYSLAFNGTGTRQLVLPDWPVLSFSSLYIGGAAITQAQDNSIYSDAYGYRFLPWDGIPPGNPLVLELSGGAYYYPGQQNVAVAYRAGYQVTNEAQSIPASTAYVLTPLAPYGIWASDEGVTYANGTPLTATTSTTPLAGQYRPPAPDLATPRLTYTFNAADAGLGVLLTYGFVPADIEQVAIELIMERGLYRNRIGVRSQMLAGQETIVYDTSGFTSFIKRALGAYVSVLPPAIGASV